MAPTQTTPVDSRHNGEELVPGRSTTIVPVPDPTKLTTEQLFREIGRLEEIVNIRVDGTVATINTRLDAMDKALKLLQDSVDKSPTIPEIYSKHEEMFRNLDSQIQGIKETADALNTSNATAIAAALQAQKEAVSEQNKANTTAINKSEAAVSQQLTQITQLSDTRAKASDDKIADLKDRLQEMESRLVGSLSRTSGKSEGLGTVGAIILGAFTFLSLVVMTISLVFNITK